MDSQHFDAIMASVAQSQSRRRALQLLGAALVGAGSLRLLRVEGSEARRRRKKKGGTLPPGAPCQRDAQCRRATNICEVPQNASNSDRACCGATGAVCGGVNADGDFQPPFCCIGEAGVRAFVCSESDPDQPNVRGTCLPAPEEL